MEKIAKLANQILISSRTISDLSSIKSDFAEIKRKTSILEKSIISFKGEDISWEATEEWKPQAEEIIQILESLMEKF